MKEPCCPDMRAAQGDEVIIVDKGLGVCISTEKGRVPIPYCPWCTKKQEHGLYTSPSMTYRP